MCRGSLAPLHNLDSDLVHLCAQTARDHIFLVWSYSPVRLQTQLLLWARAELGKDVEAAGSDGQKGYDEALAAATNGNTTADAVEVDEDETARLRLIEQKRVLMARMQSGAEDNAAEEEQAAGTKNTEDIARAKQEHARFEAHQKAAREAKAHQEREEEEKRRDQEKEQAEIATCEKERERAEREAQERLRMQCEVQEHAIKEANEKKEREAKEEMMVKEKERTEQERREREAAENDMQEQICAQREAQEKTTREAKEKKYREDQESAERERQEALAREQQQREGQQQQEQVESLALVEPGREGGCEKQGGVALTFKVGEAVYALFFDGHYYNARVAQIAGNNSALMSSLFTSENTAPWFRPISSISSITPYADHRTRCVHGGLPRVRRAAQDGG